MTLLLAAMVLSIGVTVTCWQTNLSLCVYFINNAHNFQVPVPRRTQIYLSATWYTGISVLSCRTHFIIVSKQSIFIGGWSICGSSQIHNLHTHFAGSTCLGNFLKYLP
jgi:hypothetical protein